MSTESDSHPTLILASGSPRRRELLSLLGLPFVVRPSDVVEANHVGEGPAEMAQRLSQLKAQAALSHAQSGWVVAADTLVYLEGQVLGKPADLAEAVQMLRRLRGRPHVVFSGVTVLDAESGVKHTLLAETTVWMRDYGEDEIMTYVASGDALDKAGAYAIQHEALSPVARVEGCYANVMGLPLCHLYGLLGQAGLALAQTPARACNRFNRRTCDVATQILETAHHQR